MYWLGSENDETPDEDEKSENFTPNLHQNEKRELEQSPISCNETFAKRSILFKAKKGDNFNHKNTLSILRIKI